MLFALLSSIVKYFNQLDDEGSCSSGLRWYGHLFFREYGSTIHTLGGIMAATESTILQNPKEFTFSSS